jgi:hypothetical protein
MRSQQERKLFKYVETEHDFKEHWVAKIQKRNLKMEAHHTKMQGFSKAVLRRNCITISAYITKGRFQIA